MLKNQIPSYLQMSPIDLVDDLQVSRKQVLEQIDRPALQCLRQDSVVGVGTGANHNVPGLNTERISLHLDIKSSGNTGVFTHVTIT